MKIILSLYRYENICGSGGVASFMSATDDVSDHLHSPAALLTRIQPAVAIVKKAGQNQSLSGRFEKEKASYPYGKSKQDFLDPWSKLVTVPTAISWFLGFSNQQDQARWSYLQFRKFLTTEHVPRITDFCICICVVGCKLPLQTLCDNIIIIIIIIRLSSSS